MNTVRIVAATALALVAFTPVNARHYLATPTVAISTLFNTGVDATGVSTTGNGADLHWTVGGGSAFNGGTNGSFPIGPWLAGRGVALGDTDEQRERWSPGCIVCLHRDLLADRTRRRDRDLLGPLRG